MRPAIVAVLVLLMMALLVAATLQLFVYTR